MTCSNKMLVQQTALKYRKICNCYVRNFPRHAFSICSNLITLHIFLWKICVLLQEIPIPSLYVMGDIFHDSKATLSSSNSLFCRAPTIFSSGNFLPPSPGIDLYLRPEDAQQEQTQSQGRLRERLKFLAAPFLQLSRISVHIQDQGDLS